MKDYKLALPIFVYGTLKQGYENHFYLTGSELIAKGSLLNVQGYSLPGYEYPFARDKRGETLEGELYVVPLQNFPAIHYLETGYQLSYGTFLSEEEPHENQFYLPGSHYGCFYFSYPSHQPFRDLSEDLTPLPDNRWTRPSIQ